MKLYICQTLDGYIAREDGSIDFLDQFNDLIMNSNNLKIKNTYSNFLDGIENVVEGYTTYSQIDEMGYGDQFKQYNHYVVTKSHLDKLDENVTKFVDFDMLEDLQLNDETTFLVGGSSVIHEALKRKLVSTIIITGLPMMLGSGIKLFDNVNDNINLEIISLFNDNKFYQIEYKVTYTK